MHYRRCCNSQCLRPFQINQFDSNVGVEVVRGYVICPHCGFRLAGEDPDALYQTHPMAPAQERHFNALKLTEGFE